MLKQWLLSGRTDTKARDLCMISSFFKAFIPDLEPVDLRSANAILDHLTYITPTRNLLYVTDATVKDQDIVPTHQFEHLTCFLPGVLALGAAAFPDVPRTHMWAARGLAHTCWTLYADSPTGLAPDVVIMSIGNESQSDSLWMTHVARWEQGGAQGDPPGLQSAEPVQVHDAYLREYKPNGPRYLLRPEAVESFFLLWRTTGDIAWRERGWSVFEALMNETSVEGSGFASLRNVYEVGGSKLDEMPR
jgi:mannosyl-oligosaccharide alpha-1,2-mannosidase